MRPIYETEHDLIEQEKAAEIVARLFHCKFEKTPQLHRLDMILKRNDGSLLAVHEHKSRKHRKGTFPTVMIELDKFRKSQEFARSNGVPYWLTIKWSDGEYGLTCLENVQPGEFETGWNGRKDRKDPRDWSEVIYIPLQRFLPIDKERVECPRTLA